MSAPPVYLPDLIRAALRVDFFPHHPDAVVLKQTHISYVLLAGEYVFKIKKAVRFPFLDYSTLEKRRYFCEEEVRLNRRLAPTVYLGVLAIVQDRERYSLADSARAGPNLREYTVKMRHLPEENFLDRLVREGKARKEHCDRIATRLASFYTSAPSDRATLYGSPDAIRANLEKNLAEMGPFIGATLSSDEFRRIQDYQLTFAADHRDLLEKRMREGRVREGHGDLRAEHVCFENDPIVFDCVEFSEQFRYCDTASEIAFLAMDLDYLGAPLLADYFVSRFQSVSQDSDLLRLLPLYKTYRACVRGKVETLRSQEPEVREDERLEAKQRARRYFHLAHRYSSGPCPPAVIVVCGLAGSGKSTIARGVSARTAYQVLNSDVVRKQLAGAPLTRRSSDQYGQGLYSESFNTRTYDELLKQTEECLKSDKGVIVDATFKEPQHRRQFLELSARLGRPMIFVECRASESKTLERLKNRERRSGEVSDATIGVYLRQREEFVPLSDIPDSVRMVLDTEQDPEDAAETVLHFLDDQRIGC
jgi:aminoglycoside phosphotransferase family enzyme/predicted kinase